MPEPILLLRLEGPLQSWGVRSRWSRRDTGPEPGKSAIIGMLGCAAGVSGPDWRSASEPDRTLDHWDRATLFGVRVDRPGVIETDYHTVQGWFWQADGKMKTASSPEGTKPDRAESEPPRTEVTWRDYLHDASFLVALSVKPEHRAENADLIRKLAGELDHPEWPGDLKNPKWPIYLGRKSCVPSRPVFDRLTDEFEDVESALRAVEWSAPRSDRERKALERAKVAPKLEGWIEDPAGEYERQDAMRINQLRFYDFRRCRRIEIDTAQLPWRIV